MEKTRYKILKMGSEHPVAAGLKVLARILKTQKQRGRESVNISPEAESLLGAMPMKFIEAGHKSDSPSAPAATTAQELIRSLSSGSAPVEVASEPVSPKSETEIRASLNQIFKDLKSSEACQSLGTLFETVVFATGNPTADIMFVGEAPGAEEEKQRKPFVGPEGQKLNQMLQAMGIAREMVYISNIVKFRPKKGDGRLQGSSNRPPTGDEMRACLPYIRREIEAVGPKVIVALGKTAAEGLLDKGGSISSFRQDPQAFAGVPVVVTYHPNYVLRQEREQSPDKVKETKKSVWQDMLKVMELAGLEISEKQRGYFQ